jgi:hypothetical protein
MGGNFLPSRSKAASTSLPSWKIMLAAGPIEVRQPWTYIKLDIGETLAYTSLGISNYSDVFNLALSAESSPKTFFNIGWGLVLLLLRSVTIRVGVQDGLIVNKSEVANKHTSAVICGTGVGDAVDSQVPFEDLGTIELCGSLASSR